MGPGHLAVGLAAKPAAPNLLLIFLLIACEALDLLSILFTFIGIEDIGISQTDLTQGVTIIVPGSIAWSHGLFMSITWSFLFAALAYLVFKDRQVGMIIGLVVFSHWILDFIVHGPDLPLFFKGSQTVGLGLWSSGPGLIISIILEFVLIAGGIAIYLVDRRRRSVPG